MSRPHLHVVPLLLLSLIAASSMLMTACGDKNKPTNNKDSVQAMSIGAENFAIVQQGRIVDGPVISGTLAPKAQATMRAQIAGAVLQTYFEQGQRVGSGALLARIDDRAIRDMVTSAQSGLTAAQNNLKVAQKDQERLQSLYTAGAIAQRDVDNAERAVIAAQATVAQAQSQLAGAQKQLALTQVRAPFSGTVSAKLASTGDIVQPGTPIYTVVEPSSMELEASIPAEHLSDVKIGSVVQFTISGYPDKTYNGTVKRINPTADPSTRQVKVFVEIPNSAGSLFGNLYAEGRITVDSHSGLSVPLSAIDRRMTKPAVMKLEGGHVKKVPVTLGITDELASRVEITSGVALGDTLLSGPAIQLSEGTLVQVSNAPTPTTASDGRKGQ